MKSWLEFWNAPNAIYASNRHRQAYSATVLAGVSRYLPPDSTAVVLDWGCGEAIAADELARMCRTLLLFEPAGTTRRRLLASYASHPKVEVLEEAKLAAIPPASIDLIVVNSVVQYLNWTQFVEALHLFDQLLKRDGRILLGDIVDPDTPLIRHVAAFMSFAWRNGFLLAGVLSLARNLSSPYRQLRRSAGYASYRVAEMLAVLDENGFVGERLSSNIAVSQLRSSYLARKREPLAGKPSSASRAID
jgi:hypothetical protein